MKQLAPLLDGDALDRHRATPSRPNLDGASRLVVDENVIRPPDSAARPRPAIVVMRGRLCPDGAIVKRTVADDAPLTSPGRPMVFGSPDEACDALKAGRFAAGDVVVLTRARAARLARHGHGVGADVRDRRGRADQAVAVITDGQMSGLVNRGLVVGEVSPEAAAGGPLGLVRDGDLIAIDVNARTVDLEVPAGELAAGPPGGRPARGAGRVRLAVGLPAPGPAAARGRGPETRRTAS